MSASRTGGSKWIVPAVVAVALIAVVVLASLEKRAQGQADEAAAILERMIDDPSLTTTPDLVHEKLGKLPDSTSRDENPETNEKRLNELYVWKGIGGTHQLHVAYRVGSMPLLHAYSRSGPVPWRIDEQQSTE
jgi:hypothetical protein